jgi:hypothetical protein
MHQLLLRLAGSLTIQNQLSGRSHPATLRSRIIIQKPPESLFLDNNSPSREPLPKSQLSFPSVFTANDHLATRTNNDPRDQKLCQLHPTKRPARL